MFLAVKAFVTALIVVAVTEISKRSELAAALLISLPIVSILSFIWIYVEDKDTSKIISMSYEVLWLVLLSLPFFIILPFLLKIGMKFAWAMLLSCLIVGGIYALGMYIVTKVLH